MHYSFDVDVATKYGLHIAILLNNIAFWIKKNEANNTHFHDGYYWTFNSIPAYEKLFPFLTYKQIKCALTKCIDEGLLIKGNYNSKGYDQTRWFALTQKGCEALKILISPTGLIHEPCRADASALQGRPIPDINTDINTDIQDKIFCPPDSQAKETTDLFNQFWEVYPKKENKKKASEIWKRKKLDLKAESIIADVQTRTVKHRQWLEGFIPHPTTYLNGERWNDDITEKNHGKDTRKREANREPTKGEIFKEWFDGQDTMDIQDDGTYLPSQVPQLIQQH